MTKKEKNEMGIAAVVEETGFIDMREQLAPKQVKAYVERQVESGRAEYNHGSILVRSKHPLDECLRRGIIDQEHHDSGKRIRNYRDCAVSKLSGRVYNAPGEGDPEMDAATIYANVMRQMHSTSGGRNQWKLITTICFAEADINSAYLSEREYGFLFQLAPNIQSAFESVDGLIADVRSALKDKIAKTKENLKK